MGFPVSLFEVTSIDHKSSKTGRAASGGAVAPELPRDTRSTPESRGARRWGALARRRRAPTGADQSNEDSSNRGAKKKTILSRGEFRPPLEVRQRTLYIVEGSSVRHSKYASPGLWQTCSGGRYLSYFFLPPAEQNFSTRCAACRKRKLADSSAKNRLRRKKGAPRSWCNVRRAEDVNTNRLWYLISMESFAIGRIDLAI